MDEDKRIFLYRIDSRDIIELVNDEWLSFAAENSYSAGKDAFINHLLWEFIIDAETRELYKIILEKVRRNNAKFEIPFRCDSPSCRRFMKLEIRSEERESVLFVSNIVRTELRDSVKLMETDVERSDQFLTMCSWCKRIKTAEFEWLEVEDAVLKLRLFEEERLPRLTHGICTTCKENVMKQCGLSGKK